MSGASGSRVSATVQLDHKRAIQGSPTELAELFGVAPELLVGQQLDRLLSRRDRASQARYLEAITRTTGGPVVVHCHVSVTKIDLLCRIVLEPATTGWTMHLQRVEEDDPLFQLVVEREAIGSAWRGSASGIASLDREGRLVDHNAAFMALMSFRSRHGVPLNEASIQRRPLVELLADAGVAPLLAAFAAERPTDRRFHGRIQVGERALELTLSPTLLPVVGHVGFALLVHDRTEEDQLATARTTAARAAGMAEIASGILHNAGNVLNSIGVCCHVAETRLAKSKVDRLGDATQLLVAHADDASSYLKDDPQGRQLLPFLTRLSASLAADHQATRTELGQLRLHLEHVAAIVAQHQAHAGASVLRERCRSSALVHEAVGLAGACVEVTTEIVVDDDLQAAMVDRHHVLQILVNLIVNARAAVRTRQPDLPMVTISVTHQESTVSFSVRDNGVGISAEVASQIFRHGFTTKVDGHGVGLHTSVLAATNMGGSLRFHSDGVGLGACFELSLPIAAPHPVALAS